MSSKQPQGSASDNMTRKQRRAAERAARKSARASGSGSGGSGGSSGGSSRSSMLVVTVAAVVIGLVAVAALVLVSGGLGGDDVAEASMPENPAPAEELRDGRTLVKAGSTPAVTIDAYEDPQCPACGTFTTRIEPLIIAKHVEDGIASFTYNDLVFLGDESWDAAIAMRVADDMGDKFWDYHHVLFHNQSGEGGGAFSRERLADMAELVGLDRDEFLDKLDDPAYRAAVAEANEIARALEVSRTPTLIINGEYVEGVPTWEDLDALITEAAESAEAAASGA